MSGEGTPPKNLVCGVALTGNSPPHHPVWCGVRSVPPVDRDRRPGAVGRPGLGFLDFSQVSPITDTDEEEDGWWRGSVGDGSTETVCDGVVTVVETSEASAHV